MRWFKHDSISYNNLKFQDLLDQYKMVGYGVWWVCCELVAQQVEGKRPTYSITKDKNWLKKLYKITEISYPTLQKILQLLADSNLISKKALKIGTLSIPKMKERCDEYTDKIGRKSRQSRDNISLEQNRTDKNREEEIGVSSFKKKRYYDGLEMRFSKDKWWVIPKEGGRWLEFTGDLKDTVEK